MLGIKFYHSTIRKYVSIFGTLFNDIEIDRVNNLGAVQKSIKIPISYSEKQRDLARINSNPDLTQYHAVIVPRMGFELTTMTPSKERNVPRTKRVKFDASDPDNHGYQYSPVAWDFNFELNIFVKNNEDGTRILEQILPFFNPDFTVSANMIPELTDHEDVKIILQDISKENTYEGNYEQITTIVWTLNFSLQGYFYSPNKEGGIIKDINVSVFDDFDVENISDIDTVPYLANTAIEDIKHDDPWVANTTITES